MPDCTIPACITEQLALADPSWHAVLNAGLAALAAADPAYLTALARDHYLPTGQRLFAAFAQPLPQVRTVLMGEGPYPREASATGVCFVDGAVRSLWSEDGLSKSVNRATSLRNFIKMLLVADGQLAPDATGGAALAPIAARVRAGEMIDSMAQLHSNLTANGFLLLNAALVFRPHVAPTLEARAWQPFLQTVLAAIADAHAGAPPVLVLWGKVAQQLQRLPDAARFGQLASEHPYNLSFITHVGMQQLFGPLHLLRARPA